MASEMITQAWASAYVPHPLWACEILMIAWSDLGYYCMHAPYPRTPSGCCHTVYQTTYFHCTMVGSLVAMRWWSSEGKHIEWMHYSIPVVLPSLFTLYHLWIAFWLLQWHRRPTHCLMSATIPCGSHCHLWLEDGSMFGGWQRNANNWMTNCSICSSSW